MLIAILSGSVTIPLFNHCVFNTVRDISTHPLFHILLRLILHTKKWKFGLLHAEDPWFPTIYNAFGL